MARDVTPKRYAIYYAPPQSSPLALLASRWLGRDPQSGERHIPGGLGAIDPAEQEAMTAEPRRYGFHATLKPPFALQAGRSVGELVAAVAEFAASRSPFAISGLKTARIGSFVALAPTRRSDALNRLAGDCVREFDPFRAPPADADLNRRRAHGLTPEQDLLLLRWGYPYVMEEFRFHLTLTGSLPDNVIGAAVVELSKEFDSLCPGPFPIDSICLFEQANRESPFSVLRRFEFASSPFVD